MEKFEGINNVPEEGLPVPGNEEVNETPESEEETHKSWVPVGEKIRDKNESEADRKTADEYEKAIRKMDETIRSFEIGRGSNY